MDEIREIHELVNQLRTEWEKVQKGIIPESEFKAFQEKIEKRLDSLEEMVKKAGRPPRGEGESLEKKAFEEWLRKGAVAPEYQKALRVAEGVAGGYLAPPEYVNDLIRGLTEATPFRKYAKVKPTSAGAVLQPKKTGAVRARWVGEGKQRTETADQNLFGLEEIRVHTLTAEALVSLEDLEDSSYDIEGYLTTEFTDQFAVAEGEAFIKGTGKGQPEGVLQADGVIEVLSGDANKITADGIIALEYAIKKGYASRGVFFMRRQTVKEVRLLKDSQGRYLWQPSIAAGQPPTLDGYPVEESPDMPEVASGAYPVIFGDFYTGYLIVDRITLEIQRLVEKYALSGQVGFLARRRVGGQVVVPEAIAKLKIGA